MVFIFKNGKVINTDENVDQVVNIVKDKIITWMMLNHNITWLSDEIERKMYELIFDALEPYILGNLLSENIEHK